MRLAHEPDRHLRGENEESCTRREPAVSSLMRSLLLTAKTGSQLPAETAEAYLPTQRPVTPEM